MVEKFYNIDDAVIMLGCSRATIYNRSNKADSHKDKLFYEDSEEGRKILLDSSLEYKLNLDSKKLDEPKEVKSKIDNNIVILELLNKLDKAHEKTLMYSEQAGQVKLLIDSEKRKEEDYFKVKSENEQLRNVNQNKDEQIINLTLELEKSKQENENLRLENDKIKTENQQLKQKSFFGLKFGK